MDSWTIFKVRGIPVRLHITLLIAIPYFALVMAAQFGLMAELAAVDPQRLILPSWAWGLLLALGLFVCVGLHELGHSLLARRSGRKVQSVTLMLLGGVSQIEGEHDVTAPPEQQSKEQTREALIAAAGPFVSFGLAILFFALSNASNQSDLQFGSFYLGQLNMTIAVFNLLPAFPLDGGRVLRALLSKRMGLEKGTGVAVTVGKGFAILFGVLGVLSLNLILILVALFVYLAGAQEYRTLQVKSLLTGLTVGDLMRSSVKTASSATSVDYVLRELLDRKESRVPVVQSGGEILGIAEIQTLLKIPEEQRRALPVGFATEDDIPHLKRSDPAISAIERMMDSRKDVAAVINAEGKFEGLIDQDIIAQNLQLRQLSDSSKKAA